MTLIVLAVIGVLAIALVTSVAVIVHDLAIEPPQYARHVEPTRLRHLDARRSGHLEPGRSSFEPTLVGR